MGAWSSFLSDLFEMSSAWRSSPALATLTLSILLSCSPPPPDEQPAPQPEAGSEPVPSPSESAPAEPEPVDPHGEWTRWKDTDALREDALRRLTALPSFGFGRPATRKEIAAVDIDVMPDGTGLPEGRGTVSRGRELYRNQCVQCHGEDGRGAEFEAIAGREPDDAFPFAETGARPTVGNYWPYATTLYDYIYRAMPQAVPGSLPPDDVYSLVAYVLFLNDLLPEDASLNRESLPAIEMPARDRFVYDDRKGGPELR
jgi:hypothetical protein